MPSAVSTHTDPLEDDVDPTLLDGVNDDTSGDPPNDDDSGDADDDLGGASDEELQLARDNGWTPSADWGGSPDKWVDAKQFADRSKGINALLKRENADLKLRIERIEGRVDANAEAERTRAIGAIDSLIADAEALRVQAITDADGAAVVESERNIRRLEAEKAKLTPAAPKPAAANPEDKAFSDAFVARNPWLKDTRIARVAVNVARDIAKDSPELQGHPQEFLPELRRRMIEEYPELMGRNMRAARTEGNGSPPRGPTKTTKQTYENMPKDAREVCDRLVKQGTIRKREDYVANYWAENQ